MRRLLAPLAAVLTSHVLLAGGAAGLQAPASPKQDVTFKSGTISLAATLLLPPGAGPFPAVVLVHGSGASDRSNPWTTAYADALVQRGIAVLHPDKRGSGTSQGDWQTASLLDLAADAQAGVAFLKGRSEIDTARIGLIGFSQGGHVVPAAAAQTADVAFAIDVSGSVVPILEQIGDEWALMAERAGLGDVELAALKTVHERGVRFALSGQDWDAYLSALEAAKRGKLGATDILGELPTTPDSPAWDFLRLLGEFDPMTYWKELRVPMLFVFGGQDTQIRVGKSIERLRDELAPLEANYSVLLFNPNGHALFRADELDFIATWIKDRGQA